MEINKFPQILIINLKRFRYESNSLAKVRTRRNDAGGKDSVSSFIGEKNEALVDFKISNLDLTKYSKDHTPVSYDLYAICNHLGTISAGHYTAVCKHPVSNRWIEFDDKIVRTFPEREALVTANAYLLFYRKREIK